jgi:hypothetical protein
MVLDLLGIAPGGLPDSPLILGETFGSRLLESWVYGLALSIVVGLEVSSGLTQKPVGCVRRPKLSDLILTFSSAVTHQTFAERYHWWRFWQKL